MKSFKDILTFFKMVFGGYKMRSSQSNKDNNLKYLGTCQVPPYQGDEPYIFISYSHDDSDLVYPELERFYNDGYNIWYDEGITSGERWREVVERALINSSLVVFFISRNAVESINVRNEVFMALDWNISVIPIFLEESELKYGLEYSLKSLSRIPKYRMDEHDYTSNYRSIFKNYGFELNQSFVDLDERIDNPPFHAYHGDEPYIFISYAHADSDRVFPDLERFHDDGYNIWYDEGIVSGGRWREELESALKNSSLFVPFISRNAVASEHVTNEILLALSKGIDIIPIYLEATKLVGHGLGLDLQHVQSILKHKMSEEGYIRKYRKEFKMKGFEVKEKTPSIKPSSQIASEGIDENETGQLIRILEEQISDLEEISRDDFAQMRELYKGAALSNNEKLLEFVNNNLKSIFTSVYVDKYLEKIESAPPILPYPSLLLNLPLDSLRYDIIQATFLKLEQSGNFNDQNLANGLIRQGNDQKENNDIDGLEETVVKLYKQSQIVSSGFNLQDEMAESLPQEDIFKDRPHQESSDSLNDDTGDVRGQANFFDTAILNEFEELNTTTDSIYDLGEYEVLIILKGGTNLTSWDDVEDENDILYISEDLSDCTDLSDKYMNLKSLKAIVAMNVTTDVTNMDHMLSGCSSLEDISDLKNWDTSNVTDMNGMFSNCSSLVDISPLKDWDTSKVTDMNGMFDGCSSLEDILPLKDWDTSNVTDISGMFYACSSLIDTFALKDWDTNNVKFMSRMFRGCSSLVDVSALKNWNIINVADMNGIFKGCSSLIDIFALKNWDLINITDLSGLFYDCSSLEDISPLKNWKTKNVTDMSGLFRGCLSLSDISPMKNWNTGNVTDMSEMFYGCSSLVDILALKNWNTKKLKDINGMFANCSSLVDASSLKSWDTDSILYMGEMFDGCENIEKIPKWYKKQS